MSKSFQLDYTEWNDQIAYYVIGENEPTRMVNIGAQDADGHYPIGVLFRDDVFVSLGLNVKTTTAEDMNILHDTIPPKAWGRIVDIWMDAQLEESQRAHLEEQAQRDWETVTGLTS